VGNGGMLWDMRGREFSRKTGGNCTEIPGDFMGPTITMNYMNDMFKFGSIWVKFCVITLYTQRLTTQINRVIPPLQVKHVHQDYKTTCAPHSKDEAFPKLPNSSMCMSTTCRSWLVHKPDTVIRTKSELTNEEWG